MIFVAFLLQVTSCHLSSIEEKAKDFMSLSQEKMIWEAQIKIVLHSWYKTLSSSITAAMAKISELEVPYLLF